MQVTIIAEKNLIREFSMLRSEPLPPIHEWFWRGNSLFKTGSLKIGVGARESSVEGYLAAAAKPAHTAGNGDITSRRERGAHQMFWNAPSGRRLRNRAGIERMTISDLLVRQAVFAGFCGVESASRIRTIPNP